MLQRLTLVACSWDLARAARVARVGSGKGGKGIGHFCQKLSESEAGECPTPDDSCPEYPICKEDGANGSLSAFCTTIEAVEDCDVDASSCLEILGSCGCSESIDCTNVTKRPGGHGGRIEGFCQKLSESGVGICPTPDGSCPERPICKPDGANGDLSAFCDEVEAVEDCDVDAASCISSLTACDCAASIDCTNVGPRGPDGGHLSRMCQKFVEHIESGNTECPTRNGECPARAICKEGDGSTDTFCGAIDALDDCTLSAAQCVEVMGDCGCYDEEIDCESLEWEGPWGMH